MEFEQYVDIYKTASLSRDEKGILTVRLHSRGGPMFWSALAHTELADLFEVITSDPGNRVVILTGTGDAFIKSREGYGDSYLSGSVTPAVWDRGIREAKRMLFALVDLPLPVIAAVNGPVTAHSELPLMCDVVLCSDAAYFQDEAHVPNGLVPGDGVQIVWHMLVGFNRARHFLLTSEKIDAQKAIDLGIVGEVVPADLLNERAQHHAGALLERSPSMLRYTKSVLSRPMRRALTEDLDAGLSAEAFASLADAAAFQSRREQL